MQRTDQLIYQEPLLRLGRRLIRVIELNQRSPMEDHSTSVSTEPETPLAEGVAAEDQWHTLDDVEGALVRILAGTFGFCQECGSDISSERLNAIPYTRWCADCACRYEEALEPAD